MNDTPKAEHVAKLRELCRGIHIAMLTTVEENGSLRSRPMATHEIEEDGSLYFFTGRDAPKVGEAEGHELNVTFVDHGKSTFVSLSSHATMVDDKAKMEALWSPMLKGWFPGGIDDPNIGLMRVVPHHAEYWDSPNTKLVQLFAYAKASITGQAPKNVGEHEKVAL